MSEKWCPLAKVYDPIKVGSIDGRGTQPHDKAVIRAINSNYKINKSLKSDPKCTLFVAKLDFNTNEQTLEEHFSKYGTIVSLRLVRDVLTGLSKGYAFIEFQNKRIAHKVYDKANNKVIDGSTILVDFEFGRTLEGWKPRRLGGGFGGKKESGQLRFGCRQRPWKRPLRLNKDSSASQTKPFPKSHDFYGHSSKEDSHYNCGKNERKRHKV